MESLLRALAPLVFGVAIFTFLASAGVACQNAQDPGKQARAVNQLHYSIYLSETALGQGDYARLDVLRSGKVFYHFRTDAEHQQRRRVSSKKSWIIPEKDAAALIDALDIETRKLKSDAKATPGLHLLKLGDRLNDRDEKLDRELHVATLPAAIADRLLPLLQEAHPDLWKRKELPKRWSVHPRQD